MNERVICPKCSAIMCGPRWDNRFNVLRYHCACGFRMALPAHDDVVVPRPRDVKPSWSNGKGAGLLSPKMRVRIPPRAP